MGRVENDKQETYIRDVKKICTRTPQQKLDTPLTEPRIPAAICFMSNINSYTTLCSFSSHLIIFPLLFFLSSSSTVLLPSPLSSPPMSYFLLSYFSPFFFFSLSQVPLQLLASTLFSPLPIFLFPIFPSFSLFLPHHLVTYFF